MTEPVTRALTVRQPWAAALAFGTKTVECRTWSPGRALGQRIALHVGAGIDRPAFARPHVAALDDDPLYVRLVKLHSAVIATVTIAGAHRDAGCCRPWGSPGCYHWEIGDLDVLSEPLPSPGRLGLWKLPDALRTALASAERAPAQHPGVRLAATT